MSRNRWLVYGVSGALGVGALAGVATMTATAMELRTDNGTVLDGGGIDLTGTTPVPVPTQSFPPSPQPTSTPTPTPAPTSAPLPTTSWAPQPPSVPADLTPAESEYVEPEYVEPEYVEPEYVDPVSAVSVPSADSVD